MGRDINTQAICQEYVRAMANRSPATTTGSHRADPPTTRKLDQTTRSFLRRRRGSIGSSQNLHQRGQAPNLLLHILWFAIRESPSSPFLPQHQSNEVPRPTSTTASTSKACRTHHTHSSHKATQPRFPHRRCLNWEERLARIPSCRVLRVKFWNRGRNVTLYSRQP